LQSGGTLRAAKEPVDAVWRQLRDLPNPVAIANTNLATHFALLQNAVEGASASIFGGIANDIPESSKTTGLFVEILAQIKSFAKEDAGTVSQAYGKRSNWLAAVDHDQMASVGSGESAFEARWKLYESACELASERVAVDPTMIGDEWKKMDKLKSESGMLQTNLLAYRGPLADTTAAICQRIARDAEVEIQSHMVDDYAKMAADSLDQSFKLALSSVAYAANTSDLLDKIEQDLKAATKKFNPQDLDKLQLVSQSLLKNAAGLKKHLGFPVLLKADPTAVMSLDTLSAFRSLQEPLLAALSDPAWTDRLDGSVGTRIRTVAHEVQAEAEVISALSSTNGQPAKVKVFFIPPKSDTGPDADIIGVFRQADVQLGDADPKWTEIDKLTGEREHLLVEGTVDGTLKIYFRTETADTKLKEAEDQGSWALVRLIHDGKLERSDTGTEWTSKMDLKDEQGVKGAVVFKFVTQRPLPKTEDWPKE